VLTVPGFGILVYGRAPLTVPGFGILVTVE